MRYLTPFPVVCSCGRLYTQAQWQALRLVGYQADAVERLELRDCAACNSTQSVPVAQMRQEARA